jgi:hypothetical protein
MSDPTLTVPRDVIEPVIQAHISAAVVAALGDRSAIVQDVVTRVLQEKVDDEGKASNYNRSIPWLQWVMHKCVRDAAKAAIVEQLELQKDALKKALAAELAKKNSPLVRQLVEGMVGAMTHPDVLKYRIAVSFDDKR